MRLMRYSFVSLAMLAVCVLLSAPNRVQAGDAAEFRSHGFSTDEAGRYFAFEQFGRQEGSGFAYSHIFIVDLEKDQWVGETPIRILIEDENEPQIAARIKAFEQAAPLMQEYRIANSGVMMAASPLNENSDKSKLTFHQSMHPLLVDQPAPYQLQMRVVDVPVRSDCNQAHEPVAGFVLTLTKPDGSQFVLHEDQSVPTSRGCPIHYHLMAVFAPDRHKKLTYAVALVGVFGQGFEGPDLRYIAVPFRF